MDFLNPIFLLPILVGLILVIAGIITLKFPPKKINSLYGYRTPSSMKNMERWTFAQKFSSYESIRLGLLLSLSCLITMNFTYIDIAIGLAVGLGLIILTTIMIFVRTENAIKSRFK